MTDSIGPRTNFRHRQVNATVEEVSEPLRHFRRMTDGLTSRLRLPSLQSMRAGVVRTPHGLALALLEAGRRAGLPQSWAEQLVLWLRGEVNRLWSTDVLPLREARRRALSAESRENAAELAALQDQESYTSLCQERDAVADEIAADTARLASLNARITALDPSSHQAAS